MCEPVWRAPCGVHCFFGLLAGAAVAVVVRVAVVACVPVAVVVWVPVVVCVVVSQLRSINPNPTTTALKIQVCMAATIDSLGLT